jgi:hypothetical protein
VEPSELIAALLWDRPALLGSESRGAREFFDAMELRPGEQPSAPDDPLGIAAHAVWAEVSGAGDEALGGYGQLAESSDPLVRLLGLCLLCWSKLDPEPTRVGEALAMIEQLEDPLLQARLTTKLISSAFDWRWDQLLPTLFAHAQSWAPPQSAISVLLTQEAYNLLGAPLPSDWRHQPDPLSEYRWIGELAGGAAEAAMKAAVEERARSPWSFSMSFGAQPLDKPIAAEMQARWAGAIWLRTGLQIQLAAHLFNGGAESPSQYASAVALWVLGGGPQISQVLDLAEPHFDRDSADFIVSNLMRSGEIAARFDSRLADLALATWDLISEPTAIALLDRFPPASLDNQIQRAQTVLWSVLSLRVPQEWESRFERLDDDEVLAIVSLMTPAVAERVPLGAAARLHTVGSAEAINVSAVPTVATLADRLGRGEGDQLEEGPLPAPVVIRLAWHENSSVERAELRQAVGDLTGTVAAVIADARKGKAGFGVENPIHTLASGLVKLGEFPEPTRRLLLEAATDPSLPRHLRFDAIKVLTALVAEEVFDPSGEPGLLEQIPEAGAESFFAEYPPALMRAAKAELAIASGRVEEYLPRLLVYSRDADPRIRINAIKAATLGRKRSNNDLLESILLTGLFDPGAEVIELALDGLSEPPPQGAATQAALAQRLPELFSSGGREVRRAVARLVSKPDLPPPLVGVAGELLEDVAADRCFRVRTEVGENLSEAAPSAER